MPTVCQTLFSLLNVLRVPHTIATYKRLSPFYTQVSSFSYVKHFSQGHQLITAWRKPEFQAVWLVASKGIL